MADQYGIHAYPDGVVVKTLWEFKIVDGISIPVPTVQFTDPFGAPMGDPIRLAWSGRDWSGLYPHGQIVNGDHRVVMQGSRPNEQQGVTLEVGVRARVVIGSPEAGGQWPLWMMPDGTVRRADIHRSSQGFAWVDPNGQEVYADDVRSTIVAPANPAKGRPHPVILGAPFAPSEWDWISAQDFTPGVDRCIAYKKSTDDLFVVANTNSQIRPRGAQLADGTYLAAISTPGFTVHSRGFVPWTLPPPPPIVIPDPPGPPRPPIRRVKPIRRLHLWAEPAKARGTDVWSYVQGVPRSTPVMEGIGPNRKWINSVPVGHPMRAIWWTRDENQPQWERDAAEAEAVARGCRLLVYCDRPGWNGHHDARRLTNDGHAVLVGQQAFPMKPAGDVHDDISRSLRAVAAEPGQPWPVVLIGVCDQTNDWPPDDVDALLPMLVELANEFPIVSDIAIRHRGDAPGANNWPPNRHRWWEQLIADNPPPPVVRPPVVIPPTPTPAPRPNAWDRFVAWLKERLGIR
jgi:hypothetical protein